MNAYKGLKYVLLQCQNNVVSFGLRLGISALLAQQQRVLLSVFHTEIPRPMYTACNITSITKKTSLKFLTVVLMSNVK